MKNKTLILGLLFIFLQLQKTSSQDAIKMETVVGKLSSTDQDLINYGSYLEDIDESDLNSINLALNYFNENFLIKDVLVRDIAALIYDNYYLNFYDVFLNKDGESINSENTDSVTLKSINSELSCYGLRLSQITEGNDFFLMPKPGFIYDSFYGKVSSGLLEYFKLDSISIEVVYVYNNNGNITEYVNLIETLIIGIENYFSNFTPLISKEYLNNFYFSYLADYVNMPNKFGFDFNTIIEPENFSFNGIYNSFIVNHSNTITGEFMFLYKNLIKERGDLLYLNDFFYTYDNNEFGIPEIKKDLDIGTLVDDFNEYLENSYE